MCDPKKEALNRRTPIQGLSLYAINVGVSYAVTTTSNPPFDVRQPLEVVTMPGVAATGDELAFCSAPWGDVFFKVHVLARAAKNDAPAIIAATFKLGPDGKPIKPSMTKGVELSAEDAWVDPRPGQPWAGFKKDELPRPHVKHLVSVTAITMDFDEGNLFENQIREALGGLGIAGTYWQTWSSTVIKRRWRLALPLVRPYAYTKDGHEKVWSRVANLVLNQLKLVTLNDKLTTDWAMKTVVQPAILPCRPAPEDEQKAANRKNKPWGGVVPEVFHSDGVAIDPAEAAKAESSKHYANGLAFKARTGRDWGGARRGPASGVPKGQGPAKPYEGSPDAPEAAEAVAAWRADERTAVGLTDGLDALQRLRRDGVGARKGGRGAALRAGCWHMHRCGLTSKEIQSWGLAALEATGGQVVDNTLLKDLDTQVRYFAKKEGAADPWLRAAADAMTVERIDPATGKPRRTVAREHAVAAGRYLRILAHADHLDTPEGGKLNFAVLSKVLGMPAPSRDKASPAVIAWRHALIEAGLLSKAGERQQTRYRRLSGEVA